MGNENSELQFYEKLGKKISTDSTPRMLISLVLIWLIGFIPTYVGVAMYLFIPTASIGQTIALIFGVVPCGLGQIFLLLFLVQLTTFVIGDRI